MIKRQLFTALMLTSVFVLHGCNGDGDGDGVTLEGRWVSQCIQPSSIDSSIETPQVSNKIVVDFGATSLDYAVNEYADANCSQLRETIPAYRAPQFFETQNIAVAYTTAGYTTAKNGTYVNVIYYTLDDGQIRQHVYDISADDKLFFGKFCWDTVGGYSPLPMPECVGGLANEVDYSLAYFKQ